jgi:hypothetical protein
MLASSLDESTEFQRREPEPLTGYIRRRDIMDTNDQDQDQENRDHKMPHGSRRKPMTASVPAPKPIMDADSKPLAPMSQGLTCVKRSLPILPGMPSPIPGSSIISRSKTPLSSGSSSKRS